MAPTDRPKGRRPVGRPPLLTPERQDKIIQAIRVGNYANVAARLAGIGVDTFHTWMARGANPDEKDPRYPEFRRAVEEARAEAEVRHVARIAQASSEGAWQASAWWLERTDPKRWGRRNPEVQVTTQVLNVTPDAVAAKLQALLDAPAGELDP